MGRDIPLFNRPVFQGSDITAPAGPKNVPDQLRRHVLCRDIQDILSAKPAVYYGVGKSLVLKLGTDGQPVAPADIQVCDLSGPDGSWANMPSAAGSHAVAIDPELGRIALRDAAAAVTVSYCYGFNADMGGGEYPRADTFASSPEQPVVRVPGDFPDIHSALNALGGDGVVEVTDSGWYVEAAGLSVNVNASGHIELRASDGAHPTLVLGGEMTVTGGADSAFAFNGFLVTENVAPASASSALMRVPAAGSGGSPNQLSHLGITHCTLVPGWALKPNGDPQFPGQPAFICEPSGPQLAFSKSPNTGAGAGCPDNR